MDKLRFKEVEWMDKLPKITEPLVNAVTSGSWLLDITLFYRMKTDLPYAQCLP